jgi:hypothetical protein
VYRIERVHWFGWIIRELRYLKSREIDAVGHGHGNVLQSIGKVGWSDRRVCQDLFLENFVRYEIKYHVSGPRRLNENQAEQSIHEIKKCWYKIMLKKKVPPRLWDYGFLWVCKIENICANFSKHAHGRTPLEIITGKTPDISEYWDFEFYDWVTFFRSNAGLGEVHLGQCLGVSHHVGRLMSYEEGRSTNASGQSYAQIGSSAKPSKETMERIFRSY